MFQFYCCYISFSEQQVVCWCVSKRKLIKARQGFVLREDITIKMPASPSSSSSPSSSAAALAEPGQQQHHRCHDDDQQQQPPPTPLSVTRHYHCPDEKKRKDDDDRRRRRRRRRKYGTFFHGDVLSRWVPLLMGTRGYWDEDDDAGMYVRMSCRYACMYVARMLIISFTSG